GARALPAVLAARSEPPGRLPISFPAAGASQPATYLASSLAARSDVSTVDPTALFAFGHGLSYAPATWVGVECRSSARWPTDGRAEVAVTLRNDDAARACCE